MLRFKKLAYLVYPIAFVQNISFSLLVAIITDIIILCMFRNFPRILRSAKIFLITASALFFSVDIFTIYHYRLPLNLMMLEVAFMTNFREGFEFLADYLCEWRFIAFTAGLLLLLYVLRKIYSVLQKHKKVFAAMIFLSLLAGLYTALRDPKLETDHQRHLFETSTIVPRMTVMLVRLYIFYRDYANILNASSRDVHITEIRRMIPNVVFILGESTCRNHMQIYGYDLPTTTKLLVRKDIHIFTDTVSPHATTNLVLENMFTFYRYGLSEEWYTYTSLFSILKKAGYHTSWLSNQETSSGTSPIRLYSKQCDSYKFTNDKYNWHYDIVSYDGRLLGFLDEAIQDASERNFYLLHLLGTHNRYFKRYPPEYNKFSADDEGGFEGISHFQKGIRAEYDNAVLYNDFIVDEIIRRFEDKNAVVIYVSDHGEEVFDSIEFFGHIENIVNRNMIEVPFIIWTSQKFRQAYPELEERIASSVNRPYMTDDMIHTVLDIMGIETPGYDPSKSIINPKFDSSRKRIYAGKQYDKERGLHEIQ